MLSHRSLSFRPRSGEQLAAHADADKAIAKEARRAAREAAAAEELAVFFSARECSAQEDLVRRTRAYVSGSSVIVML